MFNIHFDTTFNDVTEADFPNFETPFRLQHQTELEAMDFNSIEVTGVSSIALFMADENYRLEFLTSNLEPSGSFEEFKAAFDELMISGGIQSLKVFALKPSETEIMDIQFQSRGATITSGTQTVFLGGSIFNDFEDYVQGRDALLSLFGAAGEGPYDPSEALSYLDAMDFDVIQISDSTIPGTIIEILSGANSFRVNSHGYVLEAQGSNVSMSNLAMLSDALYNADVNTSFMRDAFFDVHEFDFVKFTDPTGKVLFSLDGAFMYDDFANIEPVLGTGAGETVGKSGAVGAQYIYAGDGADTVQGGAGSDHLTGGGGADMLFGGGGIDTIHYDQRLSVDGASGVVVDMAAGTATDSFGATDQFSGIERVDGSGFDDVMYSGGVTAHFRGLSGSDELYGGGFADSLDGDEGDDRVVGHGGNDTLSGGDGADTINGGDGDDRIFGGDTNADLRDVIYAGAGNDRIDGGYGNDLIFGQDGDDSISGGFGADTLQGQGGNDMITGSALSDLLFGNDGDDFVNGGFGHDRINGGAGADRFYHLGIKNHGSDWVQDFDDLEGDVLVFGTEGATKDDFQINYADTGSGDAALDEAFVIYLPRGLTAGDTGIVWALVDGAGLDSLTVQVTGGGSFDLLA